VNNFDFRRCAEAFAVHLKNDENIKYKKSQDGAAMLQNCPSSRLSFKGGNSSTKFFVKEMS
jgi:hypothetical protein